MQIETFIFVHDQKIVLDFINGGKFYAIPQLKYVFLGNGDVTQIEHLSNVIVARNLPINIEQYPKLTSYTGWHCLWKNNIIQSDYVNLFEYDVILAPAFFNQQAFVIDKLPADVYGYIPFSVHNYHFIKDEPLCSVITESINDIYGIDCYEFVKSIPVTELCSITSNHTFSKNAFNEYMMWIEPMLSELKESPMAGHNVERSIILFYLIKNKTFRLLEHVLYHFQFDSHQTQGVDPLKLTHNYTKLVNNEKL